MAKSEASGKKRKRPAPPPAQEEDAETPIQREDPPKNPLHGGVWTNLDFVLFLQDRAVPFNRKIELAFDFVTSSCEEQKRSRSPVLFSRVVAFLGDWVQPLLISSDHNKIKDSAFAEAFLDHRLWVVLKFCLENSVPSLSQNLLRPITRVLIDASSALERDNGPTTVCDSTGFYGTFSDCLSLIFSSYSRTFSVAGVDLWVSCALADVVIVSKCFSNGGFSSWNQVVLLRLSLPLLEQFSAFLRFYPSPKNIFRSFVDRLLEPLLELLVFLNLRAGDRSCEYAGSFFTVVKDILSNGLFHPIHISGFLSSRSINKKAGARESKNLNESYHRHFFAKFNKLIIEKKVVAMGGFGFLFCLLITSVKKKRGVFPQSKVANKTEESTIPEKGNDANVPLFDIFIQFMEPLALECKRQVEIELPAARELLETKLMEIHEIIRTFNDILKSFTLEKIYERTQDSPERAHCTFLKKVYDIVIALSRKVYLLWLSISNVNEVGSTKMLFLISKELIACVGHFIEIEYTIIGDDLTGIWLMMLSYLAVLHSTKDTEREAFLTNEILRVGCIMISVYSELRQANRPIFALCEAVRLFGFCGKICCTTFVAFKCSSPDTCVKGVTTLVCSQVFKSAVSSAIKSIPEGQASGCINELRSDFTESLKWMKESFIKTNGALTSELLNEVSLFGCLSEMYATVLESLVVTTSNSISIGNSIDDLMKTVRPTFTSFVQNHTNNFDDFFVSLTGRKLAEHVMAHSKGLLDAFWTLIVFFRLYISCRSIFLQAISLMPPDLSKNAASAMGNILSVCSGLEWETMSDWTDGGYFSWIANPSVSLLFIIQLVSKAFSVENISACSLFFVLHVMILQRLTELNRQVKSFKYLVQRDVKLAQAQVLEGVEQKPYKKNKRWRRLLKIAKQEAADLTNFMMDYLSLLGSRGQLKFFQENEVRERQEFLPDKCSWDLGVCSLDEKTLPIAIWWLLCENIDIWCAHSSKRSLSQFSLLLLQNAISYISNYSGDTMVSKASEPSQGKVMVHHISIKLLQNISFYEHRVLLRTFMSKISAFLKKSILPAITHTFGTNIDLSSLSDLSDILSNLDRECCQPMGVVCSSRDSSVLVSFHSVPSDSKDCTGWELSSENLVIRTCQALLFLLCKLPDVHTNLRSLSVTVAYILHLERLLVLSLLSCNRESLHFHCCCLNLFVSCRRTLRHLLVAFAEDNKDIKKLSDLGTLFESSSLVQWLLKSASTIVGMSYAHLDDDHPVKLSKMFFMLMDHTSYLFLALTKVLVKGTMHSVLIGDNHILDQPNSSQDLNAWKNLEIMASILTNEARMSLLTLRNTECMGEGASAMPLKWNILSNTLSCFHGFLWSFASAMGDVDEKCSNKNKHKLAIACTSELYSCISVFEELVDCCLKVLLLAHHPVKEAGMASCTGSDLVDNLEMHNLRVPLLQSLLNCENLEVGFTIRQLFMSAAAILKLRHTLFVLKASRVKNDSNFMHSDSTSILLATSDFLLSKMPAFEKILQRSDLLWIDGALKYLEVFSICFPVLDSSLSENIYSRLINIHLRAIGKCICWQGKAATLASHETGTYMKMLQPELQDDENMLYSVDGWGNILSELKTRLRMSFKGLLRRPLQSDPVVVVQTLERVLVGVRQGCNMIYEISAGQKDGGKVSEIVAAGIDCFDLVFDLFSGRKLLGIIRSCIQNFISSLFNIILHLQNPLIFYTKKVSSSENTRDPDPGSVICMCVEVLTKIVQKHFQLKVDACNVGKSLHLPASLFKQISQTGAFHGLNSSSSFLEGTEDTAIKNVQHLSFDHHFFIDLYASCCKLLCTILRHQASEAACCISLLEESVRVLLTCLESTDADLIYQKSDHVLTTQEAIKCACYLRRVYEELRQQKDIFGTYSSYLLSDYICIYSGYGPLRTGIKREVDESLRQGVYALVDMCSPEDFQSLHTVLGEGPCRRTLATLRHDYQIYFQYQGKI